MPDTITTEDFPELAKLYDMGRGTYVEFTNLREARAAFSQAMHAHGYRPGAGKTWLKAGRAAVIEPR